MASLYLIRHGQASFGSANYDQLSPLGQRQADISGQFFAETGSAFRSGSSGDLSRQRETGERVLASQPEPATLRVDPRLNEVDNEGQIAALLPILCERDSAFADRVKAGQERQQAVSEGDSGGVQCLGVTRLPRFAGTRRHGRIISRA